MDSEELVDHVRGMADEEISIMEQKNHDYSGVQGSPFSNFVICEALGVSETERGLMVRVLDKIMRITTFLNAGELKVDNEGVKDAISDVRNYFGILDAWLSMSDAQKQAHKMDSLRLLADFHEKVRTSEEDDIEYVQEMLDEFNDLYDKE